MKYSIRRNWLDAFDLILKKPAVIFPFIIIAFLEALALECIYFSSRYPISSFANPIIRKFFGEAFIHYPANLLILPKLFYYAQVCIYIFLGAFLTAVSINIFRNIKMGLPVKARAMFKNAAKNYLSFMAYAIIIIILTILLKKVDMFIFSKFMRLIAKHLAQLPSQILPLALTIFLFFTNITMQVFLISTLPIIVLEKSRFLKALVKSVYIGIRHFLYIFTLLSLPFLIYLPITLLKSFSNDLITKTAPEINAFITVLGIIISLVIDSFIIICVSQFLFERKKAADGKIA